MGQALATGDVLRGKYRLEQVLGRGGMGIVHLATHLLIGQRVAIKVVLTTPEDKEYVTARFLREARAAALLESEHVVRILDVDNLEDGTPFMVMEYLKGEDLSAILRTRGRLPVDEAVRYVLGACEALAEAHARGIVHRDLKPSNLFRAETAARQEPVIKLLDFGISKLAGPGEDLSLTDTHAVIGSPIYMSPEQLLSSRDVDHRTDIWSLGVTLYKLASGGLPFEASSASALGAQIAATAPRPLTDLLPNPPAPLESVVMKCLARKPAERYTDVVELARALEPLASDPDLVRAVERARERGARVGSVKPGAEGAAPPVLEASGERWTRSQESDRPPPLEASGERWTRSQQSDRPPPPAPDKTKGATPVAIATAAAHAPPTSLPSTGRVDGPPMSEPLSLPARAPSRIGVGVVFALAVLAIAGGVTFVMLRKPVIAPPPPVATTSPADTAFSATPSDTTTASATTVSVTTASTTASATTRPPPVTSAARPRPRPKGTWSKDPSELDIK